MPVIGGAALLALVSAAFGAAPDAKSDPKAEKAPASVVFVVDRSGSMDAVGDLVKIWIARAAFRLDKSQSTNLIWFSDGDPFRFSARPVAADQENLLKLVKHLCQATFRGSTDPRAAIMEAINQKAEEIWVVTDGEFELEFAQAITKRAAGRSRINVLAVVLPGGEEHKNLAAMAKDTKGTFKTLDLKEITAASSTAGMPLGLVTKTLPAADRARLQLTGGVLVEGVARDSRAAKAGLRRGDVIVSSNGVPLSVGSEDLKTGEDYVLHFAAFDPDGANVVVGLRDGKPLRVTIPAAAPKK